MQEMSETKSGDIEISELGLFPLKGFAVQELVHQVSITSYIIH